MIRINLLPKQKRKTVSNAEKEIVLFVLLIVFMGTGLFAFYSWQTAELELLRQEQSSLEAEKNRLLADVKEVNDLRKQLTDFSTRIEAIRKIRSEQGLPIEYIDAIITVLPPEKIWFENFQIDSTGKITVSGISLDNQAFAQYVTELRKSPLIRSVTTRQTQLKQVSGFGLIAFDFLIQAAPAEKPEETSGRG